MRHVPLPRRSLLAAGLATAAVTVTGCREQARSSGSGPAASTPTAAGRAGATAVPGSTGTGVAPPAPASAPHALEARLSAELTRHLRPTRENPKHPGYAGAVALCQVDGRVVARVAVGRALRYGAGAVPLPESRQVPMRPDSIFDTASITKVCTAVLVLQQVDRGRFDLDTRVADLLPGFAGPGRRTITVAMLLAHTGGLPVGARITGLSGDAARRAAVLATPLLPGAVPGTVFRYSSVGLMVLGHLVERVTGQRLDRALASGLTGPLGLRDTGFAPNTWLSPADRADRLVATDVRSSRGLLRGVVHDDVANRLGGVAGHAGVFSTAADLAVIGQMLLDGGSYRGRRVLSESITRRMVTDVNRGLPAVDPERPGRTSAHGLGVVLDQPWFMGGLAGPRTFGHTGFTGTSLVVDPDRRTVLVLLTNRAHPNWSWADPDPVRVSVADITASAVS
ncbi:serine hydrolase domain-containing protein [Micromonospora sp. BQ11]|uniref:serine hydrolase domain-containing protein n=1 Tax=Micromonospora sp. BQ11 TaxID=3452212 RepID=UPI003F888428